MRIGRVFEVGAGGGYSCQVAGPSRAAFCLKKHAEKGTGEGYQFWGLARRICDDVGVYVVFMLFECV